MLGNKTKKTLNFSIDKRKLTYRTSIDYTILQILDLLQIKIPRFCYHDELNIAGNCRMCLIEVKNSIKPVIACSTRITPNIEIFTNTVFVKKTQQSILEFLLINHPLDCPICDQAGKCDLQDISFFYGQDTSRFNFEKRAVSDQNFNPYIKTIMNRCIHCTRCVRFVNELIDMPILGMMGRGNSSKISTYTNTKITHPLITNVIDLCPVGALTSNIGAFTYRNWEKESYYHIDLFDPYLKTTSIEISGETIMEILPATENINSLISNRTRFIWESLQSYRLYANSHQKNQNVQMVSYRQVLQNLITSTTVRPSLSQYTKIQHSFLSINKVLIMNSIADKIQAKTEVLPNHCDLRIPQLSTINNQKILLFIYLNVQIEVPLLESYLHRNRARIKRIIFYGNPINNSSHGTHLGQSTLKLLKLFQGRDLSSHLITNTANIYMNNSIYQYIKPYLLYKDTYKDINIIMKTEEKNKYEIVNSNSYSDWSTFLPALNFIYLNFYIDQPIFEHSNTIYNFSTHTAVSYGTSYRTFDVSMKSFFEYEGHYINCFGTVKKVDLLLNVPMTLFLTLEYCYLSILEGTVNDSEDLLFKPLWRIGYSIDSSFLVLLHYSNHNYFALFCNVILGPVYLYFTWSHYCYLSELSNDYELYTMINLNKNKNSSVPTFLFLNPLRTSTLSGLECDSYSKWSISLCEGESQDTLKNNFII